MPHVSVPLNASRGFTLTELAIVLVIISFLAGGLMMSFGAQVDLRYRGETQQKLQEARDALVGYAASHNATIDGLPYLPCPDTNGDGQGDRDASDDQCLNAEGTLPWVDLGLANQDSWGNRFRYRVAANFSRKKYGFALTTAATLRVCDQAACTTTIATSLPAVVLSHGKNGFGAVNSSGGNNPAPTGTDELENTDSDNDFVFHTPTPDTAASGEFDDMLVWISTPLLVSRMIAASRLP